MPSTPSVGELAHVLPWKRAVHPTMRVGFEFGLRQFAHRRDHFPLLRADLKFHVSGIFRSAEDAIEESVHLRRRRP